MIVDRNKLRELAIAATRGLWSDDGEGVVYNGHGMIAEAYGQYEATATANAAYIAAAHPGAIIELLDELETAEIRMMLADLYTPAELNQWLASPQLLFGPIPPKDMIHAGRFDEVAAFAKKLADGIFA